MARGQAGETIAPETRRQIVKWCLQSALGLVGYGVTIFLSAGSITWVWGWAMVGVTAGVMAAHVVVLVPINPELLAERQEGFRPEGTKQWDRWLAPFSAALGTFVLWVVAGLELRFEWSTGMGLGAHLTGLVLSILGYGLFMWAMAANAFFAEGVRIQEERGHVVCADGPYRVVRHPGYAGALLSILGGPLLLGSWWGLIPAGLAAAGYVLRTALEDRTLLVELDGYTDYAKGTRYRLVPGVW